MFDRLKIICLVTCISIASCTQFNRNKQANSVKIANKGDSTYKDTVIVDSHYTFAEAIAGTTAPKEIIKELELIDVEYYSTDGKIHQGQILTNKALVIDLKMIFKLIFKSKFTIEHAIPVVKYNWYDDLSMQDNNTYSFCYRNEFFSKHAKGMAIDINPYFNPVHWKAGYDYRQNKPEEDYRDTTINGTFYASHPVVHEFEKHGFFWGHNFKAKFDDHHFEK